MIRHVIAFVVALDILIAAALALPAAKPRAAEVAPPPRAIASADPEYRLPRDEMLPDTLHHANDTGDLADWGHALIGVPELHKITKGKGEVVAVLDTGCDSGHRDLKDRIIEGKDFTSSRSGWSDVQGHGTHCAGIIAAAENNTGMLGVVPEAKLLIVKVLGDNGAGLSTWIAAGIDYAVAWRGSNGERVSVISLSLGTSVAEARIGAAVKRALDAGIIVVAAAGNEGPREGSVGYPGGFPDVVCVAAVDSHAAVALFSSRGPQVAIAAPGVGVRSCFPGDRTATLSGTSMATPYVAGCAAGYAASLRAAGGTPTPSGFRKLLEATARDLPPPGRDTASGFGLVQAGKLAAPPKTTPIPLPPVLGDPLIIDVTPDLAEKIAGRKIKRIVIEFEKP